MLYFLLILVFATVFMFVVPNRNQKIYEKRTKNYLFKNFAITIRKSDTILVLNTIGCMGCIDTNANWALIMYDCPVIASKNFSEKFKIKHNGKRKIYIDGKNLCENINLPLNSVTLIIMDEKEKIIFKDINIIN